MKRHPDWVKRMRQNERQYRFAKLDYVRHDCGRLAARHVDAVLGTKLIRNLTYKGPREAVLFMRRYGGLQGVVTSMLGFPTRGAPTRRGDIGQVGRHALAICMGADTIVCSKIGGLRPVDRNKLAPWHWRVGE